MRKGKSANYLLGLLPQGIGKLHLFDSWEGLPEEWYRGPGEVSPVGHFKYKVPRWGDSRVIMHRGLFEDTLDGFRADNPHMTLNLVHLDCDLYSSTLTVLECLRTMFAHGSILIFDDLFGYPFWRDGQWKAWQEWIGDMPYTWIAHTPKGQAAVRLDGSW